MDILDRIRYDFEGVSDSTRRRGFGRRGLECREASGARRAQVPGRVLAASVRPKRLDLLETGVIGTQGRFRRGTKRERAHHGSDSVWSRPLWAHPFSVACFSAILAPVCRSCHLRAVRSGSPKVSLRFRRPMYRFPSPNVNYMMNKLPSSCKKCLIAVYTASWLITSLAVANSVPNAFVVVSGVDIVRFDGRNDEVRCRKIEIDEPMSCYPERDWANPGCQSRNRFGP